MTEDEFRKRLADTRFVVCATSTEMFFLWQEFDRTAMYAHPERNRYKIEVVNPGRLVQIGEFGGMPVNVSLTWWTVDGVPILAVDSVSMVAHYGMVEAWLRDNCAPRWDRNGRVAHTDAMNFHHVLNRVREINAGVA